MNSPVKHPSVSPANGGDTLARKGPFNLVRRLFHRKDPIELPSAKSLTSLEPTSVEAAIDSIISPKPSISDRLASLLTEDLPSTTLPPIKKPEQPPLTNATAVIVEDRSTSSDFAAVRTIRLAAKQSIAHAQDAYARIENNLNAHAREFERRQQDLVSKFEAMSANLREHHAKAANDLASEFQKAAQVILTESAKQLHDQANALATTVDQKFNDEFQKAAQAALAQSAQQLQAHADAFSATLNEKFIAEQERSALEMQKQFEVLRASKQTFIDDTQKQLATAAQSLSESVMRDAVEKGRADLDSSRQKLLDETQLQLMSMSRESLELRTNEWKKDFLEQVTAESAAYRQASLADTQTQLAKMVQTSAQRLELLAQTRVEQTNTDVATVHKHFVTEIQERLPGLTEASLDSEVKLAVEQGRKQLTQMVDSFLQASVPQIDAELQKLVDRHREALQSIQPPAPAAPIVVTRPAAYVPPPRTEGVHVPSVFAERPAPTVRPQPHLARQPEFSLAESATKRRFDLRDVWAGVSWGLKVGVALGVIALIVVGFYYSASPVVRLRTTPPATFFDDSAQWTPRQRARENQLARAYWDIAAREIASNYAFGSTLPADPPDAFQVEEKAVSGSAPNVDPAARARYWEKLRQLWPQPDSWERTSDWNLDWIRNLWTSATSKVAETFSSSGTSAAAPASARH